MVYSVWIDARANTHRRQPRGQAVSKAVSKTLGGAVFTKKSEKSKNRENEKSINRCENIAMIFIFGANDFTADSGASEKHFF